jgi:hypothetical protein
MAQILNLKDAGSAWRRAIDALRKEPQEGIVRDEHDQTVAIVLPVADYDAYTRYRQLQSAEDDAAVFDEVAETMSGFDPSFIEGQIAQAVAAMKAEALAQQTTR